MTKYCEESTGCDHCGQTGFRGRTGIFEVWRPSKQSRELIAAGADEKQLRTAMHTDGAWTMSQMGLAKVFSGITSIHELTRVLKHS